MTAPGSFAALCDRFRCALSTRELLSWAPPVAQRCAGLNRRGERLLRWLEARRRRELVP